MPERLAALTMRVEIDTGSPEREGQVVTDSYKLDDHSATVIRVTR